MTPTLSLQFCRIIVRLIDAYEAKTGSTDTGLSRRIFNHTQQIATVRQWNGANQSPTLKTLVAIEAFMRDNLDDDPVKSESLYRSIIAEGVREEGYTGGTWKDPAK